MLWFRLHADWATDPKVQSMNETFQRRFIMLLCLRCLDDLCKLSEQEIAFALRVTEDELQETKKSFVKKGFIDKDWNFINWDKRQYKSDSSTDRVRKHREVKQSETFQKRYKPVTVTPPDTDTDTDTDTKKSNTLSGSPEKMANSTVRSSAIEVLNFLNEKTGRSYRPVETNLKFIECRLKSGATVRNCRAVIARKCREWSGDEKMSQYLRPATLFNATKFEQYIGERKKKEEG